MSGTGKGKGKGKSAPPSGGAGAEGGKGKKSKSVSRSSRAGLQFPVGRIHRHLKSKVRFRIFHNFAIFSRFRIFFSRFDDLYFAISGSCPWPRRCHFSCLCSSHIRISYCRSSRISRKCLQRFKGS